jgi:hypothetical protein
VRAAPSVKNDKTADVHGLVYRWYDLGARRPVEMPAPDDCTWLPEAWQRELKPRPLTSSVITVSDAEVDSFMTSLPQGEPCLTVRATRQRWETELLSSRHDNMVGGVWALLREGAKGHAGSLDAIVQLHDSFVDAVLGDRTPQQAEAEWNRALLNGARRVAQESAGVAGRSCDCAAFEAWLDRNRSGR